jgi:quercetin dioxygenase-like cupin family protein
MESRSAVQILSWSSPEPPSEASVERRLHAEGVAPYAWSNGPGDRYGVHSHEYEKVLFCTAGSIRFDVGEPAMSVELRPGDGIVLRRGTPHAAEVGPSGCTCLEGHRIG